MILGLGQYHIDLTRQFCNRVIEALKNENPEQAIKHLAEQQGTFKDKGWRLVTIRRVIAHEIYTGATVTIAEGVYSHIRDDHPLSPDGYASMDITWCVTLFQDDTWGERSYISV